MPIPAPKPVLAAARMLAGARSGARMVAWALLLAPGSAVATPPSAQAPTVRSDDIVVTAAWARATSPLARTGAAYLTIRNKGRDDDRLLGIVSPRAERVEIHAVTRDGGITRMRLLPGGLNVPADGQATLAPGGAHLMLIGLRGPLRQGERVAATLRFARAGDVEVKLRVGPPGAAKPPP